MSQAGPILFVSNAERPPFVGALDEARLFPVVDTDWASAARAVEEVQPAAILAAMQGGHEPHLAALSRKIADQSPYLPFVAVDAAGTLPHNALPFSSRGGNPDRLIARLRAAL
ncbi:GGDEF domain-containing protein, partial [Bradyrhizobium sp. PRIMUS42]|nr:GGDEF domain-containing protein [Bradyrhizobium sp. PRIMUS42]